MVSVRGDPYPILLKDDSHGMNMRNSLLCLPGRIFFGTCLGFGLADTGKRTVNASRSLGAASIARSMRVLAGLSPSGRGGFRKRFQRRSFV